jgi:hypothetical protein
LLLLLRIDADHRLPSRLVCFDLLVDVAELGVPVGVLFPLKGLGVGLEAEALFLQQPAHGRRGNPMPLAGQFLCQVSQRLGRPPQRRHRITALIRLNQAKQGGHQVRVQLFGRPPSPAGPSDPTNRQGILAGLQLEHPAADSRLADLSRPCHRPYSAVPQQPGLLGKHQPLLPFVQVWEQHPESHDELLADLA